MLIEWAIAEKVVVSYFVATLTKSTNWLGKIMLLLFSLASWYLKLFWNAARWFQPNPERLYLSHSISILLRLYAIVRIEFLFGIQYFTSNLLQTPIDTLNSPIKSLRHRLWRCKAKSSNPRNSDNVQKWQKWYLLLG